MIVDRNTGEIVCQGLNKYEESIILRGEIVAITACSTVRPEVAWQDLTLYTTAESCPMCQGAVVWAGIPEAVYGTSVATLDRLGIHPFRLDSPTVAAAAPFHSGRIIGGVLAERSDKIYRDWAKSRGQ